jgi:hypothetical protein
MPLSLLLVLAWVLASGAVQAQQTWQLGRVTAAGRVSYLATRAPSAGWLVGLSARRGLRDGRWDSVALDVARRIWLSAGGSVGLRVIGRYDRLRAPSGGVIGADGVWRTSRSLVILASCVAIVDRSRPGPHALRLHGAAVGARASWDGDMELTALVRYEAARGSLRIDLGLSVAP